MDGVGASVLQIRDELGHGNTRIDEIFNDQDVLALELVKVETADLHYSNDSQRGGRTGSGRTGSGIALDLHKFEKVLVAELGEVLTDLVVEVESSLLYGPTQSSIP